MLMLVYRLKTEMMYPGVSEISKKIKIMKQ